MTHLEHAIESSVLCLRLQASIARSETYPLTAAAMFRAFMGSAYRSERALIALEARRARTAQRAVDTYLETLALALAP
jgi:hypothetical protein